MTPTLQPFNHPLFIAVKKIAPALAAGNSVIVKPSEVSISHFMRCFTDSLRDLTASTHYSP